VQPARAEAPSGRAPSSGVETYAYVKVPLLSERFEATPIAVVDEDAITLRDLEEALTATHGARAEGERAQGRDVGPILDRLVTMKLFVSEAREMGLDEQPGFAKAVAEFKEQQLRQLTELRATRSVRPDAMEVERAYREGTREWKVRSLLFANKQDAVAFRGAVAEGRPFAELANDAVARKLATGNDGADWVGRAQMLPQVAQAVAAIDQAPAYTDPIEVKDGFAVAGVEQIRYVDDPKVKAAAEASSVERQRALALEKYRGLLEKKYARTDEKLWRSLSFEAPKPGFAALAKDRRAVVAIQGDKPVTVADVAAELQRYFFHGVDEPIKEKKLDAAKAPVLHKILTRRLFLRDGAAAGIPRSPEYVRAVADYEASLLFGAYVQKVVVPDVKVGEDEGKAYYEQHRADFTFPAFYKLEALNFSTPEAAQAAMKKLAAGTDFGFLRANADGQLRGDDRLVALDGQTVSANALPADLVRALGGARRDDVRTWAVGAQSLVVRVIEVTPPKEQPYLEARAAIGKKLAAENLNKAVKEVAAKLRASHRVAVYLERLGN
jgi:hypothetical protein